MNRKQWKILDIFLIVVSLLLSAFIYWIITDHYESKIRLTKIKENNQSNQTKEIECQNCVSRFLDGVLVEKGKENPFPVAVIIENHINSRPPSALARARLVYEAEAEGGITRFLAIYLAGNDMGDIEEIGPIRSARPYFIDWARELSSLFVHVGGSPAALAKISKDNIIDLNEFYKGEYFWRDSRREAPHNVYTNGLSLEKYLKAKDLREGKFIAWQFKDDEPKEEATNPLIQINFKRPAYRVEWKYNKEFNDYQRYLGGKVHKDRNGEEIRAKNVIIEFVTFDIIDDEFRLKMHHIGEGRAIICRDGVCQEGIWRKKLSSARTRFFTLNGEEFKFNTGISWIEVVNPNYQVNF